MHINTAHKLALVGLASIAAILLSPNNANAFGKISETDPITVFAAASLADVMPRLADAWQSGSRAVRVRTSIGASGVIARQIEAGADADLFISANQKWITYLTSSGHTTHISSVVARNQLVMVVPCGTATPKSLSNPLGLKRFLSSERFAMADPTVSPAGDYTKVALENLGLWSAVKPNATYAGSVRLALLLTERGGLPSFVYTTDAAKSSLACTSIELPSNSYPPIEYVGMLPTSGGEANKAAKAFLTWLTGPAAAVIWQQQGFGATVPK